MLELEDAVARILAAIPESQTERVPLPQGYARVAAASVTSPIAVPAFDNSSMDGYAVRAADVAAAGAETPVRLQLAGRVVTGDVFNGTLAPGGCVRIFTGSPLPSGADAVVMQEDTRTDPAQPGAVDVLDPVKPWENVRFRGEDIRVGLPAVDAGQVLTAGRIALLAAIGVPDVVVGRRAVVGLLATGSELQDAGEPLAPGKIYESNRAGLAPLIERAGGVVKPYSIVPDDPVATRGALERALNECDAAITCGGVSVGETDFVKAAFEELGGSQQFWKVAIKPGRPFVFGKRGKAFLFGLPGNPVSAFVTFLLLVRPALLRWQGAKEISMPAHPGILAEPLANPGGRRHFVRVTVDSAGNVRPAGVQASHMLSSLAAANGLVDVPPQTTLAGGATVAVLRWE